MGIHKLQALIAATNTFFFMMMPEAFVLRFSSSSYSLVFGRRLLQSRNLVSLLSSSTKAVKKRKPNQNKRGPTAAALADHHDGQKENDDTSNQKAPTLRDSVFDAHRLERSHTKGQLVNFFEAVDSRIELVATPTYNHRQLHPQNHTNMEQQHSRRQQMVQCNNNDTNNTITTTNNSNNKTSSSTNTNKSIFDELPFLLSENNKNSIFDIFPKQANDTTNNADAFNRETFQEYKSVIQQIMSNTKFISANKANDIERIKIWLLKPDRQIPFHLPTLIKATTSTWNGEVMPIQKTTNTTTITTTTTTTTTNPMLPYQPSNDNTTLDTNTTIKATTAEDSSNRRQQQKKKSFYKTTKESMKLHTELKEQKKRFLQSTNLTAVQYDLASNVLCYLGEFCAKMALLIPLEVAWEKIKEAGMVPKEHYMSTFLYVVGNSGSSLLLFDTNASSRGFATAGRNSTDSSTSTTSILDILGLREHSLDGEAGFATNQEANTENQQQHQLKDDTYVVDLPAEVATFHDLLYEPTEKSISLRVKHLVANGNASAAEALLDYMQDIVDKKSTSSEAAAAAAAEGNSLKLRTYLPVLRAYCEEGNCSAVLKLFTRMRNSPGVVLEPENYVLVIATLAEYGYFKTNSNEIAGAVSAGYSVGCGPKLLNELAAQMAEASLDITSASARRLHNAFIKGYTRTTGTTTTTTSINDAISDSTASLKEIPSLAAMPVNNTPASDKELVVSRVTIDAKTGICPRTGVKLRLIMLEKEERKQFLEKLVKLAETQYVAYLEKTKNSFILDEAKAANESNIFAASELKGFAEFLSVREGKPYTAIVDGANVAYFGQNFEQGKFNFYQIQFLIDALESKGEHPLVILPQKYTRKVFTSTTSSKGKKQVADEREMDIIRSLNETGKLYIVPVGCLDDYYWMLASVSDQTVARKNDNLDVSIDNTEGRWPGTRPMLLSNDQMRDHKMELLEPRLFRRWTSSHIVNYNFTAFVNDECVDREIGFSAPDFFSNEIQGNPTLGGSSSSCMAWHFPVSDWDEDERFCIRLPSDN